MRNVFGTDGIRGPVFGDVMNPTRFLEVSFAVASYFQHQKKANKNCFVLLGMDTRSSGDVFCGNIISAFLSCGIDILSCGIMTVSALSYLCRLYEADGAVMISASHNPYRDNGVKVLNGAGDKLSVEEELLISKKFLDLKSGGSKSLVEIDRVGKLKHGFFATLDYQDYVIKSVGKDVSFGGMKIVLDNANGSTGKFARKIFEFMGAQVVSLFDKPDGKNINQNCGATFPAFAAQKVVEEGADIGFCFDGDGDRIVVIDEKGRVLSGDLVIGGFAKFLKKEEGSSLKDVVVTKVSNLGLDNFLKEEGINTLRVDVGDRFVCEKMRQTGSILGGEESGHIIVKHLASIGDGVINALFAMNVVKESGEKASQALAPFTLVPSIKRNIAYANINPEVLDEGLSRLQDEVVSFVDKKNIRVLIRRSGTESAIRVLIESEDLPIAELYMEKIIRSINMLIQS